MFLHGRTRQMALAGFGLMPLAASAAAITCKGGFQLVQGNYIATPYCQDAQIASVAREYGIRVSAALIRENPYEKREVCRFVGQDIRVRPACIEAGSNGRRGY